MSKRAAKSQAASQPAAALESASAPVAGGQRPGVASTVSDGSRGASSPTIQAKDNEADLMKAATAAVAEMLSEPEPALKAGKQAIEAPGDEEADEGRTEPILTPADEAGDDDDDRSDAEEAASNADEDRKTGKREGETAEADTDEDGKTGKREDGTAQPEASAELDDEDLDELSELNEEQLDAHAKANEWPASFTKRVKKFTRQLKSARAMADNADQLRQEREELKARLEELEDGTAAREDARPNKAGETPALLHPELEKFDKQLAGIDRELAQMDRNVAWAKANPDGGTLVDAKGNPMQVDAEYVARWAQQSEMRSRQLDRESVRLVSRREARASALEAESAAQVRAMEQRAFTAYPWLKDRKSAEWKLAKKFMEEHPGFDLMPDWPLVLGQLVTGKAPIAANGNGNGSRGATSPTDGALPVRKPVPAARVPGRPGAAPVPVGEKEAGLSAAHKRMLESGSTEDATKVLAKLL